MRKKNCYWLQKPKTIKNFTRNAQKELILAQVGGILFRHITADRLGKADFMDVFIVKDFRL